MTNPLRYLILPASLLQWLAGYVPRQLGLGESIGDRTVADGIPPELPPGYFFAIWGVIFLAYSAVGIYALRNSNELTRQLSAPLVAVGILNSIWILSAEFIGNPVLDFVLIVPPAIAAWAAAYRFDRMRGLGGSSIKWTADVLTGLLAGWLTVATAISVPRASRYLLDQGPTDAEWITLWSVLAVISIGSYIFKRRISRSWWFYIAGCWGLLGILVNNWTRTGFGYFGWIALFFGLWLVYRRLTQGANGAMPLTN
ncbi:MAG: hypothetical protein AAF498_13325 [Pseudomonadota bacterium]